MADWITIAALDGTGSFDAYIAEPATAPKAAIVVIQEIFGVNAGIRAKVDRWASLGYLAIAPDMFWRFAPGLQLDPDVPEEAQRAFTIRSQFDPDSGVADIEAAIRKARALADTPAVGVVGYCLGGRMAYLAATRTDAHAAVGYYGAGIDKLLHESHAIARPLMLHFAERDHFIDGAVRAAVHGALDGNPHVTIHDYAGVDHGFAATSGTRRDDGAATLADARTEAFMAQALGQRT